MAFQYLSHNVSQMINGVFRVFTVIQNDNETTVGRASNVQKGSHISRGQWAHQVTTAALYILLHRAYAEYQVSIPESEQRHFEYEWCEQMSSDYLQFYYWYRLATGVTSTKFSDHNMNRVVLYMWSHLER